MDSSDSTNIDFSSMEELNTPLLVNNNRNDSLQYAWFITAISLWNFATFYAIGKGIDVDSIVFFCTIFVGASVVFFLAAGICFCFESPRDEFVCCGPKEWKQFLLFMGVEFYLCALGLGISGLYFNVIIYYVMIGIAGVLYMYSLWLQHLRNIRRR